MDEHSILDLTDATCPSESGGRNPREVMTSVGRNVLAVAVTAMLIAAISGCSGAESVSAPVSTPTPEPTATTVPIDFVRFFDAELPKVGEPTWYEVTDTPAHWPSLVSLPGTLRIDDGSFVESTMSDGARVLTGRLFFEPSEDYVGDLRQRLMDAGFVSEDFFENSVGLNDRLRFGDSRVEIASAVFGYAIIDVIE